MRLTLDKTWSQQQLAIKLRGPGHERQGALSWERQRLLIHAAKTALAQPCAMFMRCSAG